MSDSKGRQKIGEKIKGVSKTSDIVYNDQAGANKTIGMILGALEPKGAIGASTSLPSNKAPLIAVYNDTNATAWVKTQNGAIGAAAAAGDIAIPPYSYITIAAIEGHSHIRASSADVYMYVIQDDSFIN